LILLFTATIFTSSLLVFLIQPMFARMVLPALGGSPAVWNTAMLFYQGGLLLGYSYAHLGPKLLSVRRHALVHVGVMLLPLFVLPVAIPGGWSPPVSSNPAPWLLGLMTVAIGLPYLVVSSSNPLLQRWFSATGHPLAGDPYFLYAASNAGSMLALLAYPLLMEPLFDLRTQGWLWTGGYALLIVLVGGAMLAVRRAGQGGGDEDPEEEAPEVQAAPLGWLRVGRWVLLAFVPSSLVLSVTTYISTDIAAVPLLWVIPLCMYLLTFILVFARRELIPKVVVERAFPLATVALVMVLAMRSTDPPWLIIPLHLVAFFVAALACHGRLAQDRPHAHHLTAYYLWTAVGGVLGGLLNALAAPMLFNSMAEYPLVVSLAPLLVLSVRGDTGPWSRRLDLLLPAGLLALTLGLVALVQRTPLATDPAGLVVMFGLPVFLIYLLSTRPLRFALGVGAVLLASGLYGETEEVLMEDRTFFGVLRVTFNPATGHNRLSHGRTLHGLQFVSDKGDRQPLAYYTASGPAGQIFNAYGRVKGQRIGAVGLGIGALAAYALPGQQWTLFEIDPAVVRIAENPKFFTHLSKCKGAYKVVLGDARQSLRRMEKARYSLLVLDAYSSDAIPMHMATHQAMALYVSRLEEGGILAFHLSNQHLDLVPVMAALARDAGLSTLYREDLQVSEKEAKLGKEGSRWMVMARRTEHLARLARDPRWKVAKDTNRGAPWSDDHASLIQALDW